MNDDKGFSLIEVLLAMGLLSIGLLAVLSLHLHSTKFNTNGNVTTMANMIAQKKMESVCAGKIGDSDSPLSKATATGFLIEEKNVKPDGDLSSGGGQGGIFNVQTRIFTYPGDNDLRRVNVAVSWQRGNSPGQVTYSAVTRGNTVEI